MANGIELTVDQLSSLLRLYLDWPKHISDQPDKEANEFHFWLSEQLDKEDLEDVTGGLDGTKHFIRSNPEVVAASKYIKSRDRQELSNEREEARVHINTQVFVLIYDCIKDVSLEGTIIRGMMMDMARNGMRMESNIAVPAGSILSMTVAQTGQMVTLYHLTGEVRWVASSEESNQLGISIFNIEDFGRWEEFFAMTQIAE